MGYKNQRRNLRALMENDGDVAKAIDFITMK
jgi:NACalpha-BTF3-like transcription factor